MWVWVRVRVRACVYRTLKPSVDGIGRLILASLYFGLFPRKVFHFYLYLQKLFTNLKILFKNLLTLSFLTRTTKKQKGCRMFPFFDFVELICFCRSNLSIFCRTFGIAPREAPHILKLHFVHFLVRPGGNPIKRYQVLKKWF